MRPLHPFLLVLGSSMLLGTAVPASAQEISCQASRHDNRVYVDVELSQFRDERLLRLVKLGLPARIEVNLSVSRKWLFFWTEIASQKATMSLQYLPNEKVFVLNDRERIREVSRLSLGRFVFRNLDNLEGAIVRIESKVSTESAESLVAVVDWLKIDSSKEPRNGKPSSVLEYLADELASVSQNQCELESRR